MRPIAASAAQVMAAEVECRLGQELLGPLVTERGPLELEEQELGLDLGRPLLHELEQGSPGRVGGVGGEAQRGVRARPSHQVLDLLELPHRLEKALAVELGYVPGQPLGKPRRPLGRLIELAAHAFGPLPVDERVEVPLGLAQLRIAQRIGGSPHKLGA